MIEDTRQNTAGEGRIYSAAAKAGGDPDTEARIEHDLRAHMAEKYGEPCVLRTNAKGEITGISSINPEYFAALFAATRDYLHETEEARYYRFNEELWTPITESDIYAAMAEMFRAEGARPGMAGLERFARLNPARETATFFLATPHGGCRGIFAKDPHAEERAILFKNGTLRIRRGEPFKFESSFQKLDYLRNMIPVRYDPDAECRRTIEEFLLPALPPETARDDVRLLFAWLGIALLGVNLPQKIMLLDGAAGSGKSTFTKLVGMLVGRENVGTLRTRFLDDRFELFRHVGRTLLVGNDVNPRFLLESGAERLKSLTGGDILDAEAKTGNQVVSLSGTFNVLLTANSDLRIKLQGDVDAWRRRILVVHFVASVSEDKKVEGFERLLLAEEGPGIVNHALRELEAFLLSGALPVTDSQRARTDDLLERSDALAEFVRDRIEKASGESLTKKQIREAFFEFVQKRRWSLPTEREIGERLPGVMREIFGIGESHSIRKIDFDGVEKSVQGFNGVRWRED